MKSIFAQRPLRVVITFSFFCFTNLSLAESYSPISTIKALTFSTTGVRVKLENMTESIEGCSTQNYYYLPTPDQQSDKLVSVLLAAKISGQGIWFQLSGCQDMAQYNYPKISHIYFCDTSWCG